MDSIVERLRDIRGERGNDSSMKLRDEAADLIEALMPCYEYMRRVRDGKSLGQEKLDNTVACVEALLNSGDEG